MKPVYVVLALAGLAALPGPAFATQMKEGAKSATKATARDEASKPHVKPTGKPVSVTRGEEIFVDHCAVCHGLHGKGDGPRSAFFQPGVQYIPDLTLEAMLKGRDQQLLESIREGLHRLPEPAYVMPQFKYILSDDEIRSVLAYIKTLPAQAAKK